MKPFNLQQQPSLVEEEVEKIGLDPKAIKGAKAGEMFKKALDAEHDILKRQYTKKVRNLLSSKSTTPQQAIIPSLKGNEAQRKIEPKTRIPGLDCNRALLENVLFVNNMVIKEPEYGILFTDEFRDQAFQRWSDIDKVGMEAHVPYLVAASMVKSN
ncbi:hypothetical protein Tco_1057637 [Tanacetum coccineum]|uniref:Uncharacterized protein n=1 Tax=Tanacetum coccineum TaxID=301880 RepID=A0ABQ5H7L5_9ASTR